MMSFIRQHISVKLFISYLVVITVGVIVLATSAELAVPGAFNRHIAVMGSMMDSMMGSDVSMMADLYQSFRSAVSEALLIATASAAGIAVIVSLLVSRQVVAPVREMLKASHRIAEGNYGERVAINGSQAPADMDELGRLAISFNRMAASLEDTERVRRQLIADVTHELRTPLTTIQGYMEGLIDGVLPAEEGTYLSVYHEAERLKRLVNDLQELSRVEAGAYALNLQPVPVSTLITPVTQRMQPQFDEKGVNFELDLPENLPQVAADVDRIQQVVVNLLGNALQYTPSGGSVRLSVQPTEQGVKFHIRDTGIGIPKEHLPYIFTRFYRVDKSRSRAGGGSGIGLTISRHIIEAHGGELAVSSEGAGMGSDFWFTLLAA